MSGRRSPGWPATSRRSRPRRPHFLLPGSWVAWRASGVLAVDPSNASSTGLLDPRTRAWSPEACDAYGVDGERLAPVVPAHAPLGPIAPWLRDATGLEPDTLVVMGCGDEMAATLGAGVVEPGVVCDVLGTAEPVCAVVASPAHDPTGVVELHPHADPDTWLLENPGWLSGGAYRWFRDELGSPEIARRPRATGPTSTSCSTRSPSRRRRAPTASSGCRRSRARWRRSGIRTRAPSGSASRRRTGARTSRAR